MSRPRTGSDDETRHTGPIPYAAPGTLRRRELTAEAAARMARCRTALVINAPFFGFLVCALGCRPVWPEEWPGGCWATAATDGRELIINPSFVLTLTDGELCGLLAHEVLHAALDHPARCAGRDRRLWNCAADFVVNAAVLDFIRDPGATGRSGVHGWRLPSGGLHDPRFAGLSADQVHDVLVREGFDPGPWPGPDDTDEAIRTRRTMVADPAGDAAAAGRARDHWARALSAAAEACRGSGRLPGSLAVLVGHLLEPRVDWRVLLGQFVRDSAGNDYSWSRPDRRFIGRGLHLPGLHSPALGEAVIILDTSGSCTDDIPQFLSECAAVFEEFPGITLRLVSCDVEARHVADWRPGGAAPRCGGEGVRLVGGGDTSFAPPFEMIRREMWRPDVVVFLTDLCGDMPGAELDPQCPVLWVVTDEQADPEVPFGRVCHQPNLAARR